MLYNQIKILSFILSKPCIFQRIYQNFIQVKGKKMYFLLDQKNGKFVDPTLFDFVVGLKRKI